MVGHHRWLAPDYADGVSDLRSASTGDQLPAPRHVSVNMHQDGGFHEHAVTVLLVIWGQFLDHDITLTSKTKVDQIKYSFVKIKDYIKYKMHPCISIF